MLEWAYEIQNHSTYTRIFVYWHCSICCYLSVDEIVEIFHQDFAEQLFIARDQDVISMLVQTVKWRRYIIYNISREICKAVVLLPFLWLFHDFSLVSYNRFIIVFSVTSMCCQWYCTHYTDVIMGAIASQITNLTIVYLTVYSDADQRKHQSSTSLAFVRGIHRGAVNSSHKWPVPQKMFPFDGGIMQTTNIFMLYVMSDVIFHQVRILRCDESL